MGPQLLSLPSPGTIRLVQIRQRPKCAAWQLALRCSTWGLSTAQWSVTTATSASTMPASTQRRVRRTFRASVCGMAVAERRALGQVRRPRPPGQVAVGPGRPQLFSVPGGAGGGRPWAGGRWTGRAAAQTCQRPEEASINAHPGAWPRTAAPRVSGPSSLLEPEARWWVGRGGGGDGADVTAGLSSGDLSWEGRGAGSRARLCEHLPSGAERTPGGAYCVASVLAPGGPVTGGGGVNGSSSRGSGGSLPSDTSGMPCPGPLEPTAQAGSPALNPTTP